MKVTVWLVTRERAAWIAAAETLGLCALLLLDADWWARSLVGLPLLAHLGHTAATALPMGSVPGRPEESKRQRRNQDLRSQVIGFLNEVRRVEAYAQRSKAAGMPDQEVERQLRSGRRGILEAAARVARVAGTGAHEALDAEEPKQRIRPLVHDVPKASPVDVG